MRRVRSRPTTVSGLVAGMAMLVLTLDQRLGLHLGEDVRMLLLTTVAGGIAALGITARADNVTSEGTDATIRRRESPPGHDP